MTFASISLFLRNYWRWRHFRHQLLHGGVNVSGCWHRQLLADGVLRYSDCLPREEILNLLSLASDTSLSVALKEDSKRSVFRVYLAERSFILKRYHRLHRWSTVSPDQKSWLGAHRLRNNVACHAWYRRNDLREALILFEDVGDYDLFMKQCLRMPPEKLNWLFAQAGKTIAQLHAQKIFHADTKPGNFVFFDNRPKPEVRLIDTDDVRHYWILSTAKKTRNLAQFLGCTQKEDMKVYPAAQLAFCQEYSRQLQMTMNDLLSMMPAVRKAIAALYPNWEKHNQKLWEELQGKLQAGKEMDRQEEREAEAVTETEPQATPIDL